MCRLIGIEGCANIEKNTQEQIWIEFFDLSKNGCVPKTVEKGHSDGYGVVGYRQGAVALYYRSELPPYEDTNLESLINLIVTLDLDLALGHLRKATKGSRTIENNQPLLNGKLSFATNGTIRFPELAEGENDSRVLFKQLIDNNNIEEVLKNLEVIEYTSATLLFTDGSKISAARWFNEKNSMAEKLDYNSYYTLYKTEGEGFKIFSSEITAGLKRLNAETTLLENHTVEI